ncbi:MAG: universal stress protein [Thermomicrobiales bacterium]
MVGSRSGVKTDSMAPHFQRLLVPVNGTAGDDRALAIVGALVHKEPVHVTLVYVIEVKQSMPLDAELPSEIEKGEAILQRAEQLALQRPGARSDLVLAELLQARTAGAAIVDEAIERKADAIVMAVRNHHRQGKITLGETVEYVLKNASCEVMAIRVPPTSRFGASSQ